MGELQGEIGETMSDTATTLLFFAVAAAFAVGFYIASRAAQRAEDDARAAFWSQVSEPIIYRSQDIEDGEVYMRAEHAKKMLKMHANVYLLPSDIHCFVFGSDSIDPSLDFQRWADLKDQQALKIRAEFRKEKAMRARVAAFEKLGGQVIPEFNDIGSNEKE